MLAKEGTVLETGKNWAVVLLDTGEYKKVRTTSFLEVGQIYESTSPSYTRLAIAAVLVLMLITASIDYFSVKAYAQVSAQVEIGVNRYGRVVHVAAIGGNGENIVKTIAIKNAKAEDAVDKIVEQAIALSRKHGVTNDPKLLKVSISGNVNQKFKAELQQKMDESVQKIVKNLPDRAAVPLKKNNRMEKNEQEPRSPFKPSEKNNTNQRQQRIIQPETRSDIPDFINENSNRVLTGKNGKSNEQKPSPQTNLKDKGFQSLDRENDEIPGQESFSSQDNPKNNPENSSQLDSHDTANSGNKQESTRSTDQSKTERKQEKNK